MGKTPKKHSAEFKFRVVLESIQKHEVAEVARRYKAETIVDMLIVDLNQDAPVVTGPRARD